ncbi:hypothetical protein B0H19DRAFT_1097466 [Mycena capillaripes]|nr:hypothetical protein B0H19DRAFT_1097466 [Mycena capillaripes]
MAYHPITGGAGGGWGTGGYNARNPEIHPNEKAIAGGTGGKGGDGVQTGGNGGFGEGSQLTQEEWMTYRHIMGGIGGNGGCGDYQGGAGGAGGRSMIDGPLISAVHGEVPHLTTAQFCQQYRLSDDICKLLVDGGFKTAKGLVKITTTGVEEIGLRPRHIADLERALKKFVAEKVK